MLLVNALPLRMDFDMDQDVVVGKAGAGEVDFIETAMAAFDRSMCVEPSRQVMTPARLQVKACS